MAFTVRTFGMRKTIQRLHQIADGFEQVLTDSQAADIARTYQLTLQNVIRLNSKHSTGELGRSYRKSIKREKGTIRIFVFSDKAYARIQDQGGRIRRNNARIKPKHYLRKSIRRAARPVQKILESRVKRLVK